jgi:hypothetical protein
MRTYSVQVPFTRTVAGVSLFILAKARLSDWPWSQIHNDRICLRMNRHDHQSRHRYRPRYELSNSHIILLLLILFSRSFFPRFFLRTIPGATPKLVEP